MKKLTLTLLCLFVFLSKNLWSQSSPIPMLQNTADQLIATLKQNKNALKANHQIIYQAVERLLLPNVDVEGMSRSVLGREQWMKATPAERQLFSQAFTRLVIRTYATPLDEYTDETVKFAPIRGSLENRFVRVSSTIIRSKGSNIPLNYSLVAKNGSWKIYDFSVEGVSLLQSFRSQFAQALQNSNMQALVKQMQESQKSKS